MTFVIQEWLVNILTVSQSDNRIRKRLRQKPGITSRVNRNFMTLEVPNVVTTKIIIIIIIIIIIM